ncbi:hypothetical protein T439DRAFT_384592 [Meredithblackwellia eburnea MCA 4105]
MRLSFPRRSRLRAGVHCRETRGYHRLSLNRDLLRFVALGQSWRQYMRWRHSDLKSNGPSDTVCPAVLGLAFHSSTISRLRYFSTFLPPKNASMNYLDQIRGGGAQIRLQQSANQAAFQGEGHRILQSGPTNFDDVNRLTREKDSNFGDVRQTSKGETKIFHKVKVPKAFYSGLHKDLQDGGERGRDDRWKHPGAGELEDIIKKQEEKLKNAIVAEKTKKEADEMCFAAVNAHSGEPGRALEGLVKRAEASFREYTKAQDVSNKMLQQLGELKTLRKYLSRQHAKRSGPVLSDLPRSRRPHISRASASTFFSKPRGGEPSQQRTEGNSGSYKQAPPSDSEEQQRSFVSDTGRHMGYGGGSGASDFYPNSPMKREGTSHSFVEDYHPDSADAARKQSYQNHNLFPRDRDAAAGFFGYPNEHSRA